MKRDEARRHILEHGRDYLTPAKKSGYICPVCESGSGPDGTGITTKDGIHFTCWAGCFTHADIIDIIGKEKGLSDYNAKLEAAAGAFGITIDKGFSHALSEAYQKKPENERKAGSPDGEAEPDYTDFFLQANRNIEKTNYHRGLSLETLNRFNIGYVENWKHPKLVNPPPSPRLIIPTGKHSYLARDTRSNLTEDEKKRSKMKVGKVRVFNSPALYNTAKPVFIVEGEIDALSIIDAGGEAVGLGSISNVRRLLSILETKPPEQPLILALDNDERGKKAETELADGLERLKLPFYRRDITGGHKDANEALNADREAFRAAVVKAVEDIEEETREAAREALEMESAFHAVNDFFDNIGKDMQNPPEFAPTGFEGLDALLDGGLYPGLYVMGALSSLGKTTFALQIADNVAASGRDVLIFSLEMARKELIAKSISRLTFIHCMEQDGDTRNAKTTRGILSPARYNNYNDKEWDSIEKAAASYQAYAGNIYITEAMGDVGVNEIRERVKKQIRITGKPPVILIDYLQILKPADMKSTDKQNTDRAVTELKRLSRDYGIPVIAISSFNRENYNAPVNMASFKESGAIEYSSDALIGLQYDGMDYKAGENDKERTKRLCQLKKEAIEAGKNGEAQKIQAKVLKNRNGSKGEVLFRFWPMFNYFEDVPEEETAGDDWGEGWSQAENTYPTITMKPVEFPKKKKGTKKKKADEEPQEASDAAGNESGDLV